jgi:phage antirepressor YoqD-like protein
MVVTVLRMMNVQVESAWMTVRAERVRAESVVGLMVPNVSSTVIVRVSIVSMVFAKLEMETHAELMKFVRVVSVSKVSVMVLTVQTALKILNVQVDFAKTKPVLDPMVQTVNLMATVRVTIVLRVLAKFLMADPVRMTTIVRAENVLTKVRAKPLMEQIALKTPIVPAESAPMTNVTFRTATSVTTTVSAQVETVLLMALAEFLTVVTVKLTKLTSVKVEYVLTLVSV